MAQTSAGNEALVREAGANAVVPRSGDGLAGLVPDGRDAVIHVGKIVVRPGR